MAVTELDMSTWNRRKQFAFFLDYDDPTFNVTVEVNVAPLYDFAQKHSLSFFLASLFVSTKACNEVKEFRYRLRDRKVVVQDTVNAGSTLLLEDNTFTFVYFDFVDDIFEFCKKGAVAVEEAKTKGCVLDSTRETEDDSLLYYSVVPWISFTSLKNPSKKGKNVSIPKIVFGKYYKARGYDGSPELRMPISVEAHHALMDGYHLGQYYEVVQRVIDELEG